MSEVSLGRPGRAGYLQSRRFGSRHTILQRMRLGHQLCRISAASTEDAPGARGCRDPGWRSWKARPGRKSQTMDALYTSRSEPVPTVLSETSL